MMDDMVHRDEFEYMLVLNSKSNDISITAMIPLYKRRPLHFIIRVCHALYHSAQR